VTKRIKEHPGFPYSTFVVPDMTTDSEPCYVAYHPELEGCMSHGSTHVEALHNLREVTELYISALLDKGLELPLPQGIEVTWRVESLTTTEEINTFEVPSVTPPTFVPVT